MGHERLDLLQRHTLANGALHAHQSDAILVLQQLAEHAHPAVAQVVNVVHALLQVGAVLQLHQVFDGLENVLPAQNAQIAEALRFRRKLFIRLDARREGKLHLQLAVEAQLVVHLLPADAGEIVALLVEEQVVEELVGHVQGGRIAGAQPPVDFDNRLVLHHRAVGEQRVANGRTGAKRIQVEQREFVDAARLQFLEAGHGDLVVAFEQHFAGALVHNVHRRHALDRVIPDQIRDLHRNPLHAVLDDVPHGLDRELAVLADQHLAAGTLHLPGAALPDEQLGIHLLQQIAAVDADDFRPVKNAQQFLLGVAEGLEQHRRQNLAAPVNARIDQILVIKLNVEPRTPVGNHPAGKKLLAGGGERGRSGGVVENSRRAVKLRNNHPLGAVDDEGAVLGHDRNLSEIDLLLLHIAHGLHAVGLVPGHEANCDLEGRRVGHAPLQALLHIVFEFLERVAHELEARRVVEIVNREDRMEDGLQPDPGIPLLRLNPALQEAVEGLLLNLNQIRNLEDSRNLREFLADAKRVLGELDLRQEIPPGLGWG